MLSRKHRRLSSEGHSASLENRIWKIIPNKVQNEDFKWNRLKGVNTAKQRISKMFAMYTAKDFFSNIGGVSGLARIYQFPLGQKFLRLQMHGKLLRKGPGRERQPAKRRRSPRPHLHRRYWKAFSLQACSPPAQKCLHTLLSDSWEARQ